MFYKKIKKSTSSLVSKGINTPIAPIEVKALHPAFDVTPAELVTAIITEKGIYKHPYAF